jgi:hypothetical protein
MHNTVSIQSLGALDGDGTLVEDFLAVTVGA